MRWQFTVKLMESYSQEKRRHRCWQSDLIEGYIKTDSIILPSDCALVDVNAFSATTY
jgi:hypothetical protein